jgi:hypothetical protein
MMSPSSDDDEILLARIREAARESGAMAEAVRRLARTAFATRAQDPSRLLARLSYDSLLEDAGSVRAAGGEDRRMVTFEAATLSVEIEVTGDRLLGQVVPPAPVAVEMMTLDGVAGRATADQEGCFTLPAPQPGPVRFGCRTGVELVLTDWIRL